MRWQIVSPLEIFFSLSVSLSRINGNHVIDIHAWELLNGGSRLCHDWKK